MLAWRDEPGGPYGALVSRREGNGETHIVVEALDTCGLVSAARTGGAGD